VPAHGHPLGVFRTVLVLGGARSGKSALAERLAAECGEPVLYVATATAGDEEMVARIARHQAERAPTWRTLEEPLQVAQRVDAAVCASRNEAGLESSSAAGGAQRGGEALRTVVVEDLTLLLANLIALDEPTAETRATDQVTRLVRLPCNVVLVSNEVGMGLVPPYPLGRLFRDALGRVNQAAAAACGEVYLVVAGITLRLK
jgi:adenosylcobinamide kinase / adenosylcobinamide-phosphate guanylyltransferase